MRGLIVVALAAGVLCGCANDQDRRQAAVNCQSVGVTEGDPYYDVCRQAYVSQEREQQLTNSYRTTQEVERSQYRRNPER